MSVDVRLEVKSKDNCNLLILGSPRSGTTLLSAMLGCHPDIAMLNEDLNCSEFNVLSKKVVGNKLCVPNQIEITHSRTMSLADRFMNCYQAYTNLIRKKFDLTTPTPRELKAKYSITDYVRKADNLHIFAVVRSPEDVIESIKTRGQQNDKVARYRWRRAIEVLYELHVTKGLMHRLAYIHFDRLVSDPEGVIRKIISRLDLEYDESVMRGYLHTPQYLGNEKIDSSKKSMGIDTDLQHSLLRLDEELSKKYQFTWQNSL